MLQDKMPDAVVHNIIRGAVASESGVACDALACGRGVPLRTQQTIQQRRVVSAQVELTAFAQHLLEPWGTQASSLVRR